VKAGDIQKIERYVQLAFLFHPYIITNCAAKTTTGEPFKSIKNIIIEESPKNILVKDSDWLKSVWGIQ
jgi:hypothetical protein